MMNVMCMQPMELGFTRAGMSYIWGRQTTRPTTTLTSLDQSTIRLWEAGLYMDATAVTALFNAGIKTYKVTTAAVVWATVNAVERAEVDDRPLPTNMERMLHLVLDADLRHLSE